MVWPILLDFNNKIIKDIESISKYDSKWFSMMTDEGYNFPQSATIDFPNGWWWHWGN